MLHMYVFLNKSQGSKKKKRNIIKSDILKISDNVNDRRRKLNACHF